MNDCKKCKHVGSAECSNCTVSIVGMTDVECTCHRTGFPLPCAYCENMKYEPEETKPLEELQLPKGVEQYLSKQSEEDWMLPDGKTDIDKDNQWVPEFLLLKLGQIAAARNAIDQRHEEIKRSLIKEEEQYKGYYLSACQHVTDQMLKEQGGSKKSVKLLTGTVGYRGSSDRLDITDMDWAIDWASRNLEPDVFREAISGISLEKVKAFLNTSQLIISATKILKTPLTNYFKKTGAIPDGCDFIEAENIFYVRPVVLKLPEVKDGNE